MGKEESTETKEETPSTSESSDTTKEQTSEQKKEEVEKLRTVIKVNEGESASENNDNSETKEPNSESEKVENPSPPEEKKEDTQKPANPEIPKPPEASNEPSGSSREDLEQRRNMLQSIKDFDFQIKKNQEDIGKMNEKLDGLTKDLDDLVSLYEIVSEQMNPFVGLSKVTKKRIDALENFTQEIEDIKTRMGEVESVVEKGLGGIKRLTKNLDKKEPDKIDNLNLKNTESEVDVEEETNKVVSSEKLEQKELIAEKTDIDKNDNSSNEDDSDIEIQTEEKQIEPINEPKSQNKEPDIKIQKVENTDTQVEDNIESNTQENDSVNMFSSINNTNDSEEEFSDNDFEILLNESIENLFAEQNIDNLINEFLLNLK